MTCFINHETKFAQVGAYPWVGELVMKRKTFLYTFKSGKHHTKNRLN